MVIQVTEYNKLTSMQFIINASQPASDKIFDVSAFEKFLQDKIKVDGRVGNLGDIVQISQQGEGKIEVIAHTQFSGRYLKYLSVHCNN
jgi:large subunit ribosomal protein L22e